MGTIGINVSRTIIDRLFLPTIAYEVRDLSIIVIALD